MSAHSKRVLLHVGTHKTGSTSLQWGLTHAREMLAGAGICYPQAGIPEQWRLGQHDLAWSQIRRATHLPGNITGGRAFDEGGRATLWQSLCEEINVSNAHTIVLSSEEFDVLDAEEIAAVGEALRQYDVTPVIFLRNIADLIESSYRTSILNGGYIRSIEEFAANQRTRIDYVAMLRDWLSISGHNRLIVLAYDDPRIRKDVVAAFVDRLGLDVGELPQRSREQQNESVPAFIAELARDLFRGGATQQDVNQWFAGMRNIDFSDAARNAYALTPPALRDALNERYAEEVARIKADPVLHGSVHGDLGSALAPRVTTTIASHAEAMAALTKHMLAQRQNTFETLSEDDWRALWLRHAEHGDVEGLPPLAPAERQQMLHGTHGIFAIQGALKFRRIVIRHMGEPPRSAKFMDFGCGWGRHIGVWLKTFARANITGVDIDPDNIAICRDLLPDVRFIQSQEGQALPIAADSQDMILSFSVFSHLSEESARFWLRELARLVKPEGFVVVTSWGKALFDIFERHRTTGEAELPWVNNIARAFDDLEDVERRYRHGEFVFGKHMGAGRSLDPELYGIGLMPPQWIEGNTGLRIYRYLEDSTVVPQTTYFLKRNG